MDLRQLDETREGISLDLLCEWTTTAFRRSLGTTTPPYCPWASLALALAELGAGAGDPAKAELELRQRLVDSYIQQSPKEVDAILTAKLALGGTLGQFFLGHQLVEARARWPWYLYCLTFLSSEPVEVGVARVPMDVVDLQVLAERCDACITVSQLTQQAWRLLPPGGGAVRAVHLVHHRGMWAPLLGCQRWRREENPLLDAVVELTDDLVMVSPGGDELPLLAEDGTNCAGAVVAQDHATGQCTVCIGPKTVKVERDHIARLLHQPKLDIYGHGRYSLQDDSGGAGSWDNNWRGSQPPEGRLVGIPNDSLEWHILHELVRREARFRLEQMMQLLAGRSDGPSTSARERTEALGSKAKERNLNALLSATTASRSHAAAHPQDGGGLRGATPSWNSHQPLASLHKAASVIVRMPFDAMIKELVRGSEISVFATRDFVPSQHDQYVPGLPVAVGREIEVRGAKDDWVCGALGPCWVGDARKPLPTATPLAAEGWFKRDCLLVWEVRQAFQPEDEQKEESCLPLAVGDTVLLMKKGGSRAFGTQFGGQQGSGYFPLAMLEPEPRVLVSRWSWEL